jgi:cytochrome c553
VDSILGLAMTRKPSLPRDQAIRFGAGRSAKSKLIILQVAFSIAFLAIVFPGVVSADGSGAYYPHGLGAKLEYCTDCHGRSGRGYRGFYVMPRLAGQTPEYLENQLRAFVEGTRQSHNGMIMSRVHGIGPSMQSALAEQFADLNPRAFGRAPGGLAERGRQIYEEGIPDANVPACSVCHGPEARGKGPIPRLAGQLYPYTIKVLRNWGRERGQAANSRVMQPIAQSLTRSEIEAVAAYFSSLN